MKKRILLKTIVALAVLSAVLVSSLLGVTKAEYFKTISKKLDFDVKPDLALEYILVDADDQNSSTDNKTDRDSTTYSKKQGVYENAESFVQPITIGKKDAVTIEGTSTFSGERIVYKVKIPVDETGYYSLDFNTYMLAGLSENTTTAFYTLSYVYCVGCEVLNSKDNVQFNDSVFSMPFRTFKSNTGRGIYDSEPLLYADSAVLGDADNTNDSVYQWKTLAPYRSENVRLTFKVEDADVNRGYVIWAWDFTGLEGSHSYRLFVESLSVEKTMNLDGTTKYRTIDDPYFLFPQTAYINNVVTNSNSVASSDPIKGRTGRSRTSPGRGTFVTEATDNSLGMRAEMLYDNTGTSTDNPLGIYVPLKNVKKNTTYKVTFDFSVARQGIDGADPTLYNGYSGTYDWYSYDCAFEKIFKNDASFTNLNIFQSYLVSGLTDNHARTTSEHKAKQTQVTYSNKQYQGTGIPLVKYDEVLKFNHSTLDFDSTQFPDYSTSDNVNDTYSKRYLNGTHNGHAVAATECRNFFNAVQHTEYNGQNKINWITFYNTTFSFNISNDVNLDDLYWVWAIDSLRYTAYYNIRIDNVRIEEVVEYASELENNGVKIGNNEIGTGHMCHYGQNTSSGVDDGVFNNFRGWNSTGQNYQARGYDTSRYMIKGNTYAPIVDATRFTVAPGTDDYKLSLSGRAVLDGGVDKYVYSVDGGRTWQDMTFTGTDATADDLIDAEAGIDMRVTGQTYQPNFDAGLGHDRITFDSNDASNANFKDWNLTANLEEYKYEANLEIIIAAVPSSDIDLRCEILRIINFNQIKNYRTYCDIFMSDISVGSAGNNLTAHATAGGQDGSHNTALFTEMRGYTLNTGGGPNREESGYSRVASGYSYDYDDVRVLFSDIPVHTDLSIGGWAMVEGGVDDYYWSVDEGRTWNLCSGNPVDASPDGDQRYFWYDGSQSTTDTTATSMKSKLNFQVNKVTAELDDYVGECVDVIFGAKPKGSDVLCPVARINNVAVYGVDGTFYTRIHQVVFNVAADPTNEVNDEDIKYEKWYRDDSNTANATGLGTGEALVVDKFGNYLNCSDRWTGMILILITIYYQLKILAD